MVLFCRVTVQRCISRETMFEAVYFCIRIFSRILGLSNFSSFSPQSGHFYTDISRRNKKNLRGWRKKKNIAYGRETYHHFIIPIFNFLKGNLDFQPIETFNKLESKTIKIRFDSFSINETIVSGTQFFLFVIFNAWRLKGKTQRDAQLSLASI